MADILLVFHNLDMITIDIISIDVTLHDKKNCTSTFIQNMTEIPMSVLTHIIAAGQGALTGIITILYCLFCIFSTFSKHDSTKIRPKGSPAF